MQSRILFVDDELQMRSMVAATLMRQNFDVRLATGITEALELLDREQFDLVLSDLIMHDGFGTDLLDHIHATQPHTPLVLVTAVQDIGTAISSMRRGAYDYLMKSFERDQLLTTVARALDHRHTTRETFTYRENLEEIVRARTKQLRQAITDIERSYDITLEALGDALDLKDSETEGHSRRVTAYTIALARAMNVDLERIKIIARGAFLHDIGKMAIPDSILRKPGRLTPSEQLIMREHCERGFDILRKIPYLKEVAEIVYSHQEHYDGTGYPRGLVGERIPLGARIFAVADTLDAITSDRPYRKASSFDVARQEILRCSGTQFDPTVVEVFVKVPSSLWIDLRREIESNPRPFSEIDAEVQKYVISQV